MPFTCLYSFFYPVFFFGDQKEKNWREFAADKIRVLAYPYFVWSLITIIVKSGLGSAVHQPYHLSDTLSDFVCAH